VSARGWAWALPIGLAIDAVIAVTLFAILWESA